MLSRRHIDLLCELKYKWDIGILVWQYHYFLLIEHEIEYVRMQKRIFFISIIIIKN